MAAQAEDKRYTIEHVTCADREDIIDFLKRFFFKVLNRENNISMFWISI